VAGAEFRSNGVNYVVVHREDGRENRRRSQLLPAGLPEAQPADWSAGSPLKRSEVSIRELEYVRSQASSSE
jgi:hypothetical protein